MGLILSCCRENEYDDENEALLREQQDRYGGANGELGEDDGDILITKRMKEQEQKMIQRNEELREIVENLNDKLIDISMVSNSGIVVQSTDIDEINAGQESSNHSDSNLPTDEGTTTQLKPLPIDKSYPEPLKEALKNFYSTIFIELDEQLKEKALKETKELTISL